MNVTAADFAWSGPPLECWTRLEHCNLALPFILALRGTELGQVIRVIGHGLKQGVVFAFICYRLQCFPDVVAALRERVAPVIWSCPEASTHLFWIERRRSPVTVKPHSRSARNSMAAT